MFNKKILLIIFVAIILLAVVFYFFMQRKARQTSNPSNLPSEITSLPVSNQKTIIVPTLASDDDIRKSFNEFILKKPVEQVELWKFSDSQNQPLPLDKFAQAVGMNLDPQLKKLLDFSSYELFTCLDANKVGRGIVMNIKLLSDYQGNLYQDEVKFMRTWERSLFQDTAKIIFPNFNFTQDQLKQSVTFKNGDYRYADLILPDKTSGSINYYLVDDYVIISSSKDCIKKASEYVFSTSS